MLLIGLFTHTNPNFYCGISGKIARFCGGGAETRVGVYLIPRVLVAAVLIANVRASKVKQSRYVFVRVPPQNVLVDLAQ